MQLSICSTPWLVLATGALCASSANAQQQVCFNDSVVVQTTNWGHTVSIPKFDPSQGILQSIQFTLAATAIGLAEAESLDAAPATVTLTFQSTLTLTRPDLSVIVVAIPQQSFTEHFTAFDGTIDFGGTSGASHANVMATASQTMTSPPPTSDLALFTGTGNIVLPITAVGTSTGTGAGNLLTHFTQQAGALVTVCYTYALDCNHNGIPDSTDIVNGATDLNADGIPDECQPSIVRFCFGDGSDNGGPPCPCQNSIPHNTNGCINSTGVGGKLNATGTPSISNDTLLLLASQLPPSVPAFFFSGTQEAMNGHGQNGGVLFGDGLLCVGGNLLRLAKISTPQTGGVAQLPFVGDPPLSVQFNYVPGQTVWYQVWYRDGTPLGPCGFGFNATNGVRVTWGL